MNQKNESWKILKDELLEDFSIFSLKKSTRINPRTKKPFTFLLMDGLDWVNIVALTPEKEIILVKQYRHGAESESIEFPGGCVERNEDPANAAIRELQEETGYSVKKLIPIGSLNANPAFQSIRVHGYLGFDAVLSGATKLDEGEDISTIKIPLKEFFEAVKKGEIHHSLIVAMAGLLAIKFPELL